MGVMLGCRSMGVKCVRVFNRPKAIVDSEHDEGSEDNEEDWTYPESRKTAGLKRPRSKDKSSASSSSPHKNGRGPGRPPKQMKDLGKELVNGEPDREREAENSSAANDNSSGGRWEEPGWKLPLSQGKQPATNNRRLLHPITYSIASPVCVWVGMYWSGWACNRVGRRILEWMGLYWSGGRGPDS